MEYVQALRAHFGVFTFIADDQNAPKGKRLVTTDNIDNFSDFKKVVTKKRQNFKLGAGTYTYSNMYGVFFQIVKTK